MRTGVLRKKKLRYTIVLLDLLPLKSTCACQHHTSWCSGIITEKGWSSDFPPLPSAFSDNSPMAFMLRSHNGVHCCGTVGDSHSHSQLSAVKHTFTGNSFQNHDAKIQFFFEITSYLSENFQKEVKIKQRPPFVAVFAHCLVLG